MARSSKARLWIGVGLVWRVKRYFSLSAVVAWIRQYVARSASRLRKLWTGRPSSVRPVACLRLAAAECSALAVTGNNDADAVYLLHWATRVAPASVRGLWTKLAQWGGNSSGVNIANIDNLGNVHPDTMWWHYTLGNVRERLFSATGAISRTRSWPG